MKKKTALAFGLSLLCVSISVSQGSSANQEQGQNSPLTTKFQFARVQFNSPMGLRSAGWAHDYPQADRHFLTILAEVTKVQTTPDSYVIVRLDDPALMRYPALYFSEPGTWAITPEEARNLREYFLRGGFAIFDDFDGPYQWNNFQNCIKEVLPESTLQVLTIDQSVFQCFFQIKTLDMVPPYDVGDKPVFYGIFDEKERLQVVVNFNNDIGDYWEWSDHSLYPIDHSNEGYKFGVNYVIYAMTH